MHINNIYCDIKLLYNTSINCFYSKYNISYDCNIWYHFCKYFFSLNLLVCEIISIGHWPEHMARCPDWPAYDLRPFMEDHITFPTDSLTLVGICYGSPRPGPNL